MVREEEAKRKEETAITFLSEKFLLKRIVQGSCESSNIYKHFINRFQISGLNCEVKM